MTRDSHTNIWGAKHSRQRTLREKSKARKKTHKGSLAHKGRGAQGYQTDRSQ